MLEFDRISLSFPNQQICTELSFSVKKGDILCFSGPSGRGKTSLLKLIMGILQPDSGKIVIDNLQLSAQNLPLLRGKMIWLPQNVNLPVNSEQELLNLLELNENQINLYNHYMMELGMKDGNQKLFSELSGGEKQRMVLAACLSLDRPILLLDEPVSALDDHTIDLFIGVIKTLKNKTIVSTSHNKKWLEHCNQIVKL